SAAMRRDQLAKLADPFATPWDGNAAAVVAKPDALQLEAPVGFTVTLDADNLQAPRTMMYAPNGDLFVAQSRAGSGLGDKQIPIWRVHHCPRSLKVIRVKSDGEAHGCF